MTRTYSAEQESYMLSKAAYNVVNKTASAEWAKIDHLAETDMAAWEVEAERIENEHPTREAYETLVQAEKDLIAWGHGIVRNKKEYRAQRDILDGLFARAERDIITRHKVADLTMQLSA